MRFAYFALAIAALPACTIVWGDGDDDVNCPAARDIDGLAAPLPGQIDPSTLECQYFGGGGYCGALAAEAADMAPLPTWGYCESQCTGLPEASCVNTAGCRTAYDHICLLTDGPCPALTPYIGCFAVDQTGPIQGACEGLDAEQCSRHDDCLSTYSSGSPRQFQVCLPEFVFEECGDFCG